VKDTVSKEKKEKLEQLRNERENEKAAWNEVRSMSVENQKINHDNVMENLAKYVCPEHGESVIVFSFVNSDGVGVIEGKPCCPVCGDANGKVVSPIPYEINEYRPMRQEECEEY
jgi:hypothetical protein